MGPWKGIWKKHNRNCKHCGERGAWRCDCPWRGVYRGYEVALAKWAGHHVDPRDPDAARAVLHRMRVAIDQGRFSPDGEHASRGSDQTLAQFIDLWIRDHAEPKGLSMAGLGPMLDVIRKSTLGERTLAELGGETALIERWLKDQRKDRKWSPKTYNGYLELLSRLFGKATRWLVGQQPYMASNPTRFIQPLPTPRRNPRVQRFTPEEEQALFDACDRLADPALNRPRAKLSAEQVAEIRAGVAAGRLQRDLAVEFSVSAATISQVVHGATWSPEAAARWQAQARMMRARLTMALDTGIRAGEMLALQAKHVSWTPVVRDGAQILVIELPPHVSKAGKRTGVTEYVYAATARLVELLRARRAELDDDPERFLFGTEEGQQLKSFNWTRVFELAGLPVGRQSGLVWHSFRHEAVSRFYETADPLAARELARHRDFQTSQRYMHARQERVMQAALDVAKRNQAPSDAA